MHKQARHQWTSSSAHTCQGCAAKGTAEARHAENAHGTHGVFFSARPTEGMWHAMSDPILTYTDDTDRWRVGASGTAYPPTPTSTPEADPA